MDAGVLPFKTSSTRVCVVCVWGGGMRGLSAPDGSHPRSSWLEGLDTAGAQHGPTHQEAFRRSVVEPAPPAEAASFSSCLHPTHRAHLRIADSHHGPWVTHMAQVLAVNWASCRQTGPAWGPGWGTHIVDFAKHESREREC